MSWIDYDGRLVPRRALTPGACYFERSFASHPWVVQHIASQAETSDGAGGSNNNGSLESLDSEQEEPNEQLIPSLPPKPAGDGDCCVVRLGDVMAVTRLTGSLIWNPSTMTLSLMRQAKVGVAGPDSNGLAAVDGVGVQGTGVAPGTKRLCLAGGEREAEAARSAAERARIRREKARILEEMRAWRTHPPGGTGIGDATPAGGLGKGAPNIRIVMIGCSSDRRENFCQQ